MMLTIFDHKETVGKLRNVIMADGKSSPYEEKIRKQQPLSKVRARPVAYDTADSQLAQGPSFAWI